MKGLLYIIMLLWLAKAEAQTVLYSTDSPTAVTATAVPEPGAYEVGRYYLPQDHTRSRLIAQRDQYRAGAESDYCGTAHREALARRWAFYDWMLRYYDGSPTYVLRSDPEGYHWAKLLPNTCRKSEFERWFAANNRHYMVCTK